MSKTYQILWIVVCLLFMALPVSAQKFFNLTSDEVKVDSVLPQFVYSYPLKGDYQDSIYTVELKYPEYIDMSACLLYTSPSPRDRQKSRMPSSA